MALFGEWKARRITAKASAVAGVETAWFSTPQARWSSRSYEGLVRKGYEENPVAQRAVKIVAEGLGMLRFTLTRDGVRLARHPLLDLIHCPNPRQAGPEFITALVSHLLLSGNGYVERVDGGDGLPAELYALRPERMRVLLDRRGWPRAYEYRLGGAAHQFPIDPASGASAILHLRSFHPLDDHHGLAALKAAARAVDIHDAADAWNKALLDNAARPSGALVFEPRNGEAGSLSEDQFARLKAEMAESFQGSRNAGRPLLLEGGLKWQQMALSPADMNYQETKAGAARDIALAFGVPPMLLGIPGDNSYANYQEANRALWRLTLLPMAVKLLASLNAWLVSAYPEAGLTLDFDRDAIPALGYEREALWRQVGAADFLSRAEKREILGFAPEG